MDNHKNNAGVRKIPLTHGYEAIVDEADYERLAPYKWHAVVTPRVVYAWRSEWHPIEKRVRKYAMHRVIIDAPRGIQVDHINHNGLDNRRSNLRLATGAENRRNRRPSRGASSRFLGVGWDRTKNRWQAYIRVNGKMKHLGCFRDEAEAAMAYDAAAVRYHGEFANPNFPQADSRTVVQQEFVDGAEHAR